MEALCSVGGRVLLTYHLPLRQAEDGRAELREVRFTQHLKVTTDIDHSARLRSIVWTATTCKPSQLRDHVRVLIAV